VTLGQFLRDWGYEPEGWAGCRPQTRANSHYFSGKSYIFGQKPTAKNEKEIFLYLLNEKNGIHSV